MSFSENGDTFGGDVDTSSWAVDTAFAYAPHGNNTQIIEL